jgi:hypothetical protein
MVDSGLGNDEHTARADEEFADAKGRRFQGLAQYGAAGAD